MVLSFTITWTGHHRVRRGVSSRVRFWIDLRKIREWSCVSIRRISTSSLLSRPQWCFKICRTCRRMEAPPNGHNWQFIVLVVVWSTCHICAFEGWRTRVTPTSWRTCSLFSSQVGGGTNLRGKHRGGREEDGNEGCERIKWWDMVVTHYESFLEGNPILESTEAIWCSTHRNLCQGWERKGKSMTMLQLNHLYCRTSPNIEKQ